MTDLEIEISKKLMDLGILPDRNNLPIVRQLINLVSKHKTKQLILHGVSPRFFPQPSEIEAVMHEKKSGSKIHDDLGFVGEWQMSPKDVLDVIIDLQNEG